MSEPTEQRTVNIPSEVLDHIETRLKYTEFESSERYITFVLKELLHQIEINEKNDEFNKLDEGEVQERLKSLGYLNE